MRQLFRWRIFRRSQLEEEMSNLQGRIGFTQFRDIGYPGSQPLFPFVGHAVECVQYRLRVRRQTAAVVFNDQARVSLLLSGYYLADDDWRPSCDRFLHSGASSLGN